MANLVPSIEDALNFDRDQYQEAVFKSAASIKAQELARENDRNFLRAESTRFLDGPAWDKESNRWDAEVEVVYMRTNGSDRVTIAFRVHSEGKSVVPSDLRPTWNDVINQLGKLLKRK